MDSDERILLVLPNNLGDVIMATPVLEGLRHAFPESHVTFLVESGFGDSLLRNPHCDEVFTFDRKEVRDLLRGGEWQSGTHRFIGVLEELNAGEFTLVINLAQHRYLSYLLSLVHSERMKGRRYMREGNHSVSDPWSHYLYAIPFARRFNAFHATDVYRRIGGVAQHKGGYTIALSEDERASAASFLGENGVPVTSGRILVMQPGAAYATKRWPPANFVSLGQALRKDGYSIVVSGAPSEAALAGEIAAGIGDNVCVSAGHTSFREAVAILSHAECCVTGDTALMHAAAALDVRTFALFGPTNPVETGPYGAGHFVLSGECTKRPCFSRECENHVCMRSILPETVAACIRNGKAPDDPQCDIYLTALEPDGDYALLPVCGDPAAFCDRAGSWLTRKSFETDSAIPLPGESDLREHLDASRNFASALLRMEEFLREFLRAGDRSRVTAFEEEREKLSRADGIVAFWSAVMNIRLNSVPMLDPLEGVRGSERACREVREQVEGLLTRLGQ